MKTANNVQYVNLSRVTIVSWNSLLYHIAVELEMCEKVLNDQRGEVGRMLQQHHALNRPTLNKPSKVGLLKLEEQISDINSGIEFVRQQLHKLRPKLFGDMID